MKTVLDGPSIIYTETSIVWGKTNIERDNTNLWRIRTPENWGKEGICMRGRPGAGGWVLVKRVGLTQCQNQKSRLSGGLRAGCWIPRGLRIGHGWGRQPTWGFRAHMGAGDCSYKAIAPCVGCPSPGRVKRASLQRGNSVEDFRAQERWAGYLCGKVVQHGLLQPEQVC